MRSLSILVLLAACEPAPEFPGPSDQYDGRVDDEGEPTEPADQEGLIDSAEPLADTGESIEEDRCEASDLEWVAEVHTPGGPARETFSQEDELVLVGRVRNPCRNPVTLVTASSCIVQRWEIERDDGKIFRFGPDCDGGETTWDLEPGDEHFEGSDEHTLAPGTYLLTVRFQVGSSRAEQVFEVE